MYEQEKAILKDKTQFSIEDLRLIMKILRAKDGCPWDKEQTHKSIVNSFIEETYEAVEAIETDNKELLCEELGDVLLQVIFHTQIEEEQENFDFEQVLYGICKKLIVRHPHIFGDIKAETTEKVLDNWEKIKSENKKEKTLREKLDRIAKPLPSLIRAQKVIHKSAKEGIGFENQITDGNEEKIGKMFFEVIKECEKEGLDAETVLRHYTDKCIETVKE